MFFLKIYSCDIHFVGRLLTSSIRARVSQANKAAAETALKEGGGDDICLVYFRILPSGTYEFTDSDGRTMEPSSINIAPGVARTTE